MHLRCGCRSIVPDTVTRPAPSRSVAVRLTQNAATRADLWDNIRLNSIAVALASVGLALPSPSPLSLRGSPSLNKALQRVLSEFVRRTRISLPAFVELMRGQSVDDYRPNKRMLPHVLRDVCRGYQHCDALYQLASTGVRAPLAADVVRQRSYPDNHKSADDRYAVLVKNIRKEQDNWRCSVLDLNILAIWPEVFISPFGVVDKGDADPRNTGRVIHDLSFPEARSVNDATATGSLCESTFEPCDAIATEILHQKQEHPDADIKLQAGDVASAFRNVCIHSESAFLFGGRLVPDNALVIDASAAFGWSGSPASYGVVGGAIAHVHGRSISTCRASGPFSYYWVDDHINVAADIGENCTEVERSLRTAMTTVLGHGAINETKFSGWHSRLKVLGLVFDTVAATVAMPTAKVEATKASVRAVLSSYLRRADYRSLLGRLRHVATCVRPARPFLQRLCCQERMLHRWQRVPITPDIKQDLIWWLIILDSSLLNGVPLQYFRTRPRPDVIVETDASDVALCALVSADQIVLQHRFTAEERRLILASKSDPRIGFDINYRELLSCAFAVHAWGRRWATLRTSADHPPVHVQFRIDNTSAVAWQNKLASRNPRAQSIIRLLSFWELEFGLHFSATHVAGVDNRIADAGSRSHSSRLYHERSGPGSDLAFHFRARSVAASTFAKYRGSLKAWHTWATRCGVRPALLGYSLDTKLQIIDAFIHHGFQRGFGSGRPIQGSTIAATLHGILHFFQVAALDFPCGHPQIRMLLKGVSRLDGPVRTKASVSLRLLERCYNLLDLATPSDQALCGVLCMSFFFLLWRSEIASNGKKFAWFALAAADVAVIDSFGAVTSIPHSAVAVHIRLKGSKTNQRGTPTLRMLNRSGHPFLCPVFSAICLQSAHRGLPMTVPVAVFLNESGQADCVSARSLSKCIRGAASSLGLNSAEFSAHSLRAGGATHMYRAGVDALTIQFHGRWVSDTFKQYTRLCKESVDGLAAQIVSGQKHMTRLQ